MRAVLFTQILLALCLTSTPAWAGIILINNASFEADPVADGGQIPTVSGWDTFGPINVLNPNASQFLGGATSDGQNAVSLGANGAILSQKLSSTLEFGLYRFEFDVGHRLDQNLPSPGFSLLANGSILLVSSSSTPSVGSGEFKTWTFDYLVSNNNANGAFVGANLELRLLVLDPGVGGTAVLDNFHGSLITAVPEPSSISLFSIVGLGMFFRRRMKVKSVKVESTECKELL